MEIASLVIRVRPDCLARVREQLAAIPGVEIAAAAPQGRLAITVEDRPDAAFAQSLLDIHGVEGVLSATLVYQFSDDTPETTEATP